MSHITLANQGVAAVDAKNWDEAITKLSKALQSSLNPGWLLSRSKALINTKHYEEALDDANLAFHAAYERNKRNLMVDAHYRRAAAYYSMGQYANADCCAIYSMRLIKGYSALESDIRTDHSDEHGFWKPTAEDAMFEAREDPVNKRNPGEMIPNTQQAGAAEWRRASTLRIRALTAMGKLPAHDEARKVTTSLKPPRKELAALNTQDKTADKKGAETVATRQSEVTQPKPVIPSDTPLRMQEFQSNTAISVSIFSKGVNKENLKVEFLPESVRLNAVVYPNGDVRELFLDLYAEIDPSVSRYTVTPSKVELHLVKKVASKWPQITKDKPQGKEQSDTDKDLEALKEARKRAMAEADAKAQEKSAESAKAEAPGIKSTAGPAYPSSSRTGPKDWDKIGAEDEDEEEAGVNDFFKKLYKGATPDQQRAMMKSFVESSGTSLSTDWNDVGKRTVETVPPEGVEAKKW